MFQFSGLALFRVIRLQRTRLSHSEIFGLMFVCNYPKLIAAYHVLHRLLVPRHPPYALIRFKYCYSLTSCYTDRVYLTTCFLCITTLQQLKLFSQYVKELYPFRNVANVGGLEPRLPPLRLHLYFLYAF
jgi:hypothetical protein